MKILYTLILTSHILMGWSQIGHTPVGKLTLPIQNYKRQKVEGATVKINGRLLKPQVECAIPEYCRGMYELDSLPQTNNANLKVWVEVSHPEYESFADSVYIYHHFYLIQKGMHHFYAVNQVPFRNRGLVTEVSGMAKEEVKLGRYDYIIDSAVTCMPFKFEAHTRADKWYVKHPDESAMESFLLNNKTAAIALDFQNEGGHPSCMLLTRTFGINSISSAEQYVEIEEYLRNWERRGVVKRYTTIPSPTESHRSFEVYFTPRGLMDFEKHLDELKARFGVQIVQQMDIWNCPE